ncbi:MAG: CPBP family intramembrane glutamic endopeptidase, partial [Bacteroidota bacterium]|nr:CPBP family intramembrane glutamic endopeptidase [Bacteroidota bacterium]
RKKGSIILYYFSAFLFATFHFDEFVFFDFQYVGSFLLRFSLGLFSIVLLKKFNLAVSILFHSFWNLCFLLPMIYNTFFMKTSLRTVASKDFKFEIQQVPKSIKTSVSEVSKDGIQCENCRITRVLEDLKVFYPVLKNYEYTERNPYTYYKFKADFHSLNFQIESFIDSLESNKLITVKHK